MADDLHQGHAGPVVVHEGMGRLVDPAAPADVGRLARVLLEMGAQDPHPPATRRLQPAVDVDRLVVLGDLVVLGHVRIEVVLAVEDRRLHLAVQRRADPHGVLDRGAVQHRQRSGQAEADRADVRVGLVAERVAAPAEELGLGPQLAVDLEPDDRLPLGRLRAHRASIPCFGGVRGGATASTAAATWNITVSPSAGARTCTPTGRPSSPVPNGTLMAGWPARLDAMVQTSDRYMARGSAVFAPSRNAVVGAVGPSSTS